MRRDKEEVERMIQSVGAMAEMGMTFYRAALGAGRILRRQSD